MSINTSLFGEVGTRLLVVKDRLRTWRFRVLSAALWDICVLIIAADYARAKWQLHLWEGDHWTYLRSMWMDPRPGRAGFSDDFMITLTITLLTMLVGTIGLPFIKSEEFFEALIDKLKTREGPPPVKGLSAAPSSPANLAGAQRWQRAPAPTTPPSPPQPSAAPVPVPAPAAAAPPAAVPVPTPAPVAAPSASPGPMAASAATPPPPAAAAPTPAPVSISAPPPAPVAAPAPTSPPEVEAGAMDGYAMFLHQVPAPAAAPPPVAATAPGAAIGADVAAEDNADILDNLMREAGYRVLRQVEVREGRAWHLLGLAIDHVLLLLVDAVEGTWMADDPAELVAASNWYVEGDDVEHASPVLEAAKLAEEFFNKAGALLATAGYDRDSVRATVVLSAATVENSLDMVDAWDALRVSVTAMGRGGPVPVLGDLTVTLQSKPVEPGSGDMLHGLAATFGTLVE